MECGRAGRAAIAKTCKNSSWRSRFCAKFCRERPVKKPNRQRHCVVPMIASAIVQWPGRQKAWQRRMGRRHAEISKNAVAIRARNIRTRGNIKKECDREATFPGSRLQMEYFVQQLVNGLTLGSIYGLIAIGYTMVYGIIGMINFAHGDIFMIGAFVALIVFLILIASFYAVPVAHRAADHDDRRDADDQPLQLDDREGRLPAAARLVPAGAADHRDRHVDRAVELRAGHAGPAQQADPADGLAGLRRSAASRSR